LQSRFKREIQDKNSDFQALRLCHYPYFVVYKAIWDFPKVTFFGVWMRHKGMHKRRMVYIHDSAVKNQLRDAAPWGV
jgi:hypothetical protein